jgi:tetratricopeptide (TPR) repeat protein
LRAKALLPGCALALASTWGCAHALKEPPPLSQLGMPQTRPTGTSDVETLLRQGEILYARRSLTAVQDASGVYLQAAQADPTRIDGLVGAVRSQIWIIDHEPDRARRSAAAVLAVQAAQWCLRIAPTSPVCEYWLGAALGVQARERSSTGLDALPRIEEFFRKAAAGDPQLEEGGPARALALLYARAPGWPTGPGDPERALAEARKAVALKPEYPPNQLALGETLDLNGDSQGAREAYSKALDLARSRESIGDPDAAEWIREAEKALHHESPISP